MQEHIEFITRLSENPYYPVPIEEYPRLFDFEITPNGLVYFERLKKEWSLEEGDISDSECLYLGMLHLAYAISKKDVKECHNWQAFMFLVGKRLDLEDFKTKDNLKQMGCIIDNPEYNPKLYKSHLIWKNRILSAVDAS